ncbi:F-box protein [Carex littledalei]|uniref:F-box protein n=1 Tax=Carex littledalei TaxID=544730 RepID=A0A833VGI1_9POAL|nr:F-box protein [Carex littledalei]
MKGPSRGGLKSSSKVSRLTVDLSRTVHGFSHGVQVSMTYPKIKSITDYVRFRAVCSPWRSASVAKPRHLPFQPPWLMYPAYKNEIQLFYDLWQDKIHKIPLPETVGELCCASYRGWFMLVACDHTELFLLNPLTRARVELPLLQIRLKFSELARILFTIPLTH